MEKTIEHIHVLRMNDVEHHIFLQIIAANSGTESEVLLQLIKQFNGFYTAAKENQGNYR